MKLKGITWKANKFAFVGRTFTGKMYRFVNPVTGHIWNQEVSVFGRKTMRMVKIEDQWAIVGPPGKEYNHAITTYFNQGFMDTQFKNTWLYSHIIKN